MQCLAEIARMRELTDKPFGVNLPLLFIREPRIVDLVAEQRREVRHDVGRLAGQAPADAEGGGPHRLSRRAQSLRRR